jgi:hypothetical protein
VLSRNLRTSSMRSKRPSANQKAIKKLDENPFKHIEYHNLLVILCRIPYVEKFDKIRPFFEEVFGKATVETMYITNRAYETHFNIDAIKNVYINFVKEFFDGSDAYLFLLDYLYKELYNVKIHNDIKTITGDLLLSQEYVDEIIKSRKPIPSFVNKISYLRSTINIVAASPGGGKSIYLMHEALYQVIFNAYNVHLFISGDLDESAAMARLLEIKEYYLNAYSNVIAQKNIDIGHALKRLKITVSPYKQITIYDVARITKSENVDFVMIDYDDKFIEDTDEDIMYYTAAKPYEVMDAYKEGKVIIFASQIKPTSFRSKNYVPIGFLQGSSRKEHMADSIIAMLPGPNKSTKLVVLKDRHGLMPISQAIMYFRIHNGIITEVEVKEELNSDAKVNGLEDDSSYNFQDDIIPF